MRLGIAGLLLLAVAAGCGSSGKKEEAPAGPVVPWIAQGPPEFAPRRPADRPCRANDLAIQGDVKFAPFHQDGAIAVIAIRNTGTHACRLTGRPAVRLVKDGGPEQRQRRIDALPTVFPDTSMPKSSLLDLRPGEVAGLTITWDNWCDPLIKGKPRTPPTAVRVTLPRRAGSLEADYNAVTGCIDPSKPSTIGVSTFVPGKVPKTAPWNDVLMASVPNQPVHGRRGGVLRYTVVLKNVSESTARFDRCPAYAQQLVPSGRVEVYRLNCARARPIAPGKSEAFEIRVKVPKTAPLGGNGLFWELDPFSSRSPQLHARATVDPLD